MVPKMAVAAAVETAKDARRLKRMGGLRTAF
jgi:hypothetical protein